jgi:hypothetical protein
MAKIHLAVNDACAAAGIPTPDWLLEYDPAPNAVMQGSMSQRFTLCHQFPLPDGEKLTCWPDAGCALCVPQKDALWRLAVFWEYDRSTMSLAQLSGSKPSHAGNGKLEGYAALFHSREYQQYWSDVQGVRIFFVVPSEKRLRNVAEAFRDKPAAPYVRLAVEGDLTPQSVLTRPIWRTTGGERRSILGNSHEQ